MEKFGKSVRFTRYSHSGKLGMSGMSSKLSAPGSRKFKLENSDRKMILRASFILKPENAFY